MIKLVELPAWGPKKLREIILNIQNAINERTPIASETIELEQRPDGTQFCVKEATGTSAGEEGASGGGGSSGTTIDIYGSFNGDPAIFHLKQSSPPDPL